MRPSLSTSAAGVLIGVAMLAAPAARAQRQTGAPLIPRADFDTTCAPCADFYRYANGGWASRATIPSSYPMWGTWIELRGRADDVLHQIVEDARRNTTAPATSNLRKLGLFYATCMDSARAERERLAPIRPLLDAISVIHTSADVAPTIEAVYARTATTVPFVVFAPEDPKQPGRIVAALGQGGLGLPTRDYYTSNDPRMQRIRAAYSDHVAEMLRLSGESADRAKADAQRVLELETGLAGASMAPVQMRDPNAVYHKMSAAEISKLTPHFDWPRFWRAIGAPEIDSVIVRQPAFFAAFDSMLTTVPTASWRPYLRWRLLASTSRWLDSRFVNENFSFNRNFSGAQENDPRWRRCLAATDDALSEILGQEYVRRTFAPEAKARALQMVSDLRAVLHDRIAALPWMSDSTKQQALAKLAALRIKIGYPDKWRDYSTLEVRQRSFVDNALAARLWEYTRNIKRIGGTVDRDEWQISPQTVDAYALSGEIVFPAGILQPPFFDAGVDDAMNYGGMGAVIGHEMTHHFDDTGRQFDAEGNLRDWWTPADAANYKQRAQLVVDQFDAYTVVDSATHVNGRLTLGENIADLGGLRVAYAALQKALAGKPPLAPIEGFTTEQRFFLAYARVWRQIARPEYTRTRVSTDSHAPWMWRVNGPLSNLPEFAQAFGCKEGDAMVRPPSLRAEIW